MGQKINPISLRLGIVRGWDSNWYGGNTFSEKLVEDHKMKPLNEGTKFLVFTLEVKDGKQRP